jgi:hypothetical protein
MAIESNNIDLYLQKCIGLPVSDVWRGIGSTIFIELGKLHKHSNGRKYNSKGVGDISLMFDCGWRLERKDSIVAGSDDQKLEIANQIKKLLGRSVKSISFSGRIPEITIEFGNSLCLQSFCCYRSDDWGIIFRNEGSIGKKRGKVIYGRSSRVVLPNQRLKLTE